MYYSRGMGGSKRWTEAKKTLIRQHYAIMPKLELMALLPDRSWQSVCWYGKQVLGIQRYNPRKLDKEFAETTSYSDLVFMQEMGIPFSVKYTNWERLYALAVLIFTS